MRNTLAIIDLDAVRYNAKAIKERAKTKLLAVVKADAYGHGAVQVAKAALEAGAEFLGVAIYEEGLELRCSGITAPILVFGALTPEDSARCVFAGLSSEVFTAEQVFRMQKAAEACGKKAKAHIKVDSGMHRIGIEPENIETVLEAAKKCPDVEIEGLFTHFATADMKDDSFVFVQYERFMKAEQKVREHGFNPIVHIANSAAASRYPLLARDMVRGGILLYGYPPSNEVEFIKTRPVMKFVTEVMQIREITKGETIGYGRTYTADGNVRIATLPVGYADGYLRGIQKEGYVLINGKRCPITGRICMDHTMVDITNAGDVKIGDEAVLIGRQGNEEISAMQVADWLGTIQHEVLTGITKRVPRVYE